MESGQAVAVVKVHNIYKTLDKSIAYVMNEAKTRHGSIARDIWSNAGDPWSAEFVNLGFELTNERYEWQRTVGTKRKVLAWHIIQSFAPGEVDRDEAYKIGEEFVERIGHGHYDFVLATHSDKAHIHNHIIISNVHRDTMKLRYYVPHTGRWKWRSTLNQLRNLSDYLCREHGLSVINADEETRVKRPTIGELYARAEGRSTKAKLQAIIDAAIIQAPSWSEFVSRCADLGVTCTPKGNDIVFSAPEIMSRNVRGSTLGPAFTEAGIMARLGRSDISEYVVANRLIMRMDSGKYRVQLPGTRPPQFLIVDPAWLVPHPHNWRLYIPQYADLWTVNRQGELGQHVTTENLYSYFTRVTVRDPRPPHTPSAVTQAFKGTKRGRYEAIVDRKIEHIRASLQRISVMEAYRQADNKSEFIDSLHTRLTQIDTELREIVLTRQELLDSGKNAPITDSRADTLRAERHTILDGLNTIEGLRTTTARPNQTHNTL